MDVIFVLFKEFLLWSQVMFYVDLVEFILEDYNFF